MTIYRSRNTKSNVVRKRGNLELSDDRLAFERIVHLPFDLALVHSAVQNFRIDCAKGFHKRLSDWCGLNTSYLSEATDLLQEDDCNLFPGNNSEPWIHVREIGLEPMPSLRGVKLGDLYAMILQRDDVSLLASPLFPSPFRENNNMAIDRLEREIICHFKRQ